MYKVSIDSFEGPFDLLVYLLENAKMDIYDIRVAEITEQYIAYLKEMGELDIEVGSEFIVLAAVLIRLKSRMLLPRVSESGELLIEEDPREDLVHRLTEYVRTKRIAEMLQDRWEANACIHEKPAEDFSRYLEDPDERLLADMEQFVRAFRLFLDKKKRISEVQSRYRRVRRQRVSIEERIRRMTRWIEDKLAVGESVAFEELLPEAADRYDRALTFLSLLEMIRQQDVDAEQRETYGEIRVVRREKQSHVQ